MKKRILFISLPLLLWAGCQTPEERAQSQMMSKMAEMNRAMAQMARDTGASPTEAGEADMARAQETMLQNMAQMQARMEAMDRQLEQQH